MKPSRQYFWVDRNYSYWFAFEEVITKKLNPVFPDDIPIKA